MADLARGEIGINFDLFVFAEDWLPKLLFKQDLSFWIAKGLHAHFEKLRGHTRFLLDSFARYLVQLIIQT